jgi:hypothetical protein
MKLVRMARTKDPQVITLEVYRDGGSMYASIGNWRPVAVNLAIDPDAHTFAEGVRQLVVQVAHGKLRVPIP